jgi:hypothetical protein
MFRRVFRALVAVCAIATLLTVPLHASASPARPAAGPSAVAAEDCVVPFWGIFHPRTLLATPFGPGAQAVQWWDRSDIDAARIGIYSPLTGQFQPTTEWWPLLSPNCTTFDALATDGIRAPVVGWGRIRTPFGEAVFATQYFFAFGRWGNYNYETHLFHPSTDWTPVA